MDLGDIAGLDVSGEGMERMTKMIQRLEQSFGRRIADLED